MVAGKIIVKEAEQMVLVVGHAKYEGKRQWESGDTRVGSKDGDRLDRKM